MMSGVLSPLPRGERARVRVIPGWRWGLLSRRGDRLVALPEAGPLTLSEKVYPERSRREWSSGGWPTPGNPSRMTNHPTPDSPGIPAPHFHPSPTPLTVIPMPREESQASARPSAPALVSLIIQQGVERSAPSPSTKLETHTPAPRRRRMRLCLFLPLSLTGPKSLPRVPRGGKGDQGGEGSLPPPRPPWK